MVQAVMALALTVSSIIGTLVCTVLYLAAINPRFKRKLLRMLEDESEVRLHDLVMEAEEDRIHSIVQHDDVGYDASYRSSSPAQFSRRTAASVVPPKAGTAVRGRMATSSSNRERVQRLDAVMAYHGVGRIQRAAVVADQDLDPWLVADPREETARPPPPRRSLRRPQVRILMEENRGNTQPSGGGFVRTARLRPRTRDADRPTVETPARRPPPTGPVGQMKRAAPMLRDTRRSKSWTEDEDEWLPGRRWLRVS